MLKVYQLQPTNGRASFYGKAQVVIDENGTETLVSYGTPVLKRTKRGRLVRLWNDWSLTTGTHILSFCGLHKREYLALPTE